jgi:fido (protein-threonine AMPylation protein)
MTLSPGYGETPLDGDELGALRPAVRQVIGPEISKATVYDLEQAFQADVAAELLTDVLAGELDLAVLLTDHLVRDVHRRLYTEIWSWGGVLRRHELNIGVAPEQIAVELRASLDTLNFRWRETNDFTARQLGIAVHAETVRIHPFADGNWRATRLLADLVFAAAQESSEPDLYDWALDKKRYIDLLREYDLHRDPSDLAAFIAVKPFSQ